MDEQRITEALKKHEGRIVSLEEKLPSLTESSVRLSETETQLKESTDMIARLEGLNTQLKARKIVDYDLTEQAEFVVSALKSLDPEALSILAEVTGFSLAKASEAEVRDIENQQTEEAGEEKDDPNPHIVAGKVEDPNFRYLPLLDLSIRKN